jgi:hypothetical protein
VLVARLALVADLSATWNRNYRVHHLNHSGKYVLALAAAKSTLAILLCRRVGDQCKTSDQHIGVCDGARVVGSIRVNSMGLPSDAISTIRILKIEILFLTNQISVNYKSVEKCVWSQNVALLCGYHI